MKRIALSYRPRGCRHVHIIGVKPNLADYDSEARELLMGTDRVLYPTRLYAQALADAGKKVFPSPRHYYYLGNKVRQTRLFNLVKAPHPKTRVFHGRQTRSVGLFFKPPFIAKMPGYSGEGRGVFLIRSEEDWEQYLKLTRTAYVQEYLPLDRDLRVVVIAGRLAAAYWRLIPEGDFRANVAVGAAIDFKDVPESGAAFALEVAEKCGFDDVGLDLCLYRGQWMVLEANMHYGLKGLTQSGRTLAGFLDTLIEEGVI